MAHLERPTRRTFVTGQSLPAVTTNFKPFSVAPNEADADVGAVRAFTVNIRNRDPTSSVFIREGDDGDEVEIAPHEHYPIYEPNGVKSVELRGETGGETVELRALIGHNDFALQDKIDAFLRSLSSYIGTATRDTRITAQDVDLTVGTVKDITTVSDTITIDDITATSATFDGDITGQTSFDLRVFDRTGQMFSRTLRESSTQIRHFDSNFSAYLWDVYTWTLYDPAPRDLEVQTVEFRIYSPDTDGVIDAYGCRVQIDRGDTGSWTTVSPPRTYSRQDVRHRSGEADMVADGGTYDSGTECAYVISYPDGLKVEAGDSLRIQFNGSTPAPSTDCTASIDTTVSLKERTRTAP